jgi:hypothetical protein
MLYSMMLTNGGEPTTGLSPEITGWRSLDGTDPTAEDPPIAVPTISQLAGLPIYVFEANIPSGHADVAVVIDADPGGANGMPAAERYQFLVVTPDDGALTEARILRLLTTAGQVNFRMGNVTFNAQGKMTSARFSGYKDAADANAQANPVVVFDVTQTYDGDGNLATYKAIEV